MDWVLPAFDNSCTPKPKKPRMEDLSKTDEFEEVIQYSKCNSITLDNWLVRHSPKHIEDLVIHPKKVEELKMWLKSAISDGINSKILLITGPPGCGKTDTLHVLCKIFSLQIIEWITPLDSSYQQETFNSNIYSSSQNQAQVFQDFLLRASRYSNVLNSSVNSSNKIILVKDFPNIFIKKPSTFYEILNEFKDTQCKTPLVFILSDGALCRELFINELKMACKIVTMNFNPIVHTSIVKALQRIVDKEKRCKTNVSFPSKNDLSDIASCCDGDLRSAILKLYFNTFGTGNKKSLQLKNQAPRDKKGKLLKTALDLDKKLDIFHGLGRVLYPKKEDIEIEYRGHRKKSYKFIHPPSEIVDMYSTQPNFFVGFLQENYLGTFTNINDVCLGANKLAIADLLLSHWKEKDSSHVYGLSIAVQGLMHANKAPLRSWNPMSKSNVYKANKDYINHSLRVRQTFPEFQSTPRDSFLDIVPFLKTIQGVYSDDQLKFIKEYSLK